MSTGWVDGDPETGVGRVVRDTSGQTCEKISVPFTFNSMGKETRERRRSRTKDEGRPRERTNERGSAGLEETWVHLRVTKLTTREESWSNGVRPTLTGTRSPHKVE